MGTLWFWLVAAMLIAYVVLDGFDLGVGIVYLFVARTEPERQQALRSIGPVWDGNEVWLLAAGGALFFAFPLVYASSFSGFYLPLMVVLWLLILRGLSVELRGHSGDPLWRTFFDALFSFSSVLLAIFFGAALANVVRGVPLGADNYFFLPLWTNWRTGPQSRNPGLVYRAGRRDCAGRAGTAWVSLPCVEDRRRPGATGANCCIHPVACPTGCHAHRLACDGDRKAYFPA